MKPCFIGLGHSSSQGKDTFADALINACHRRNITAVKIALADRLKQHTHSVFKWAGLQDKAFYETPTGRSRRLIPLPKINMSPVEIWVKYGNLLRQEFDLSIWIQCMVEDALASKVEVIIVPDVRFPNEVQFITENLLGSVHKVYRPDVAPLDTVSDQMLRAFQGWDSVIVNDGSVAELQFKAIDFVHEWIVKPIEQEMKDNPVVGAMG